ncbi:MAG: GntR family transcriptional regulator [Umezawaea sp.]
MIDRMSGLPVYRQVAAVLREKIESGEYGPGARLPSESELIEFFGVSRITVREAISLLRAEGMVASEHGRGVFVRSPGRVLRISRNRLIRAAREQDRGLFLADAKASDFTPSVTVEVRFEPASADHAEALGIEPGTELLVRDRVMLADGLAVQLAISRLPRTITRGTSIEEFDTGAGGVYARLEEIGHSLDRFHETVGARMPTSDESAVLRLPVGVPVLVVRRIAYDAHDRAVEVNDMVLAADRYELSYQLPAD